MAGSGESAGMDGDGGQKVHQHKGIALVDYLPLQLTSSKIVVVSQGKRHCSRGESCLLQRRSFASSAIHQFALKPKARLLGTTALRHMVQRVGDEGVEHLFFVTDSNHRTFAQPCPGMRAGAFDIQIDAIALQAIAAYSSQHATETNFFRPGQQQLGRDRRSVLK